MQQPALRRSMLVAVMVAALAVRVAAGFWWQAHLPEHGRFGFGDSQSYWVLAQRIVRGEPYTYGPGGARVYRAPGYPLLLAGLFCLVGDDPPVMWARASGALLGTIAVGGVICLAWQLFDERTALLAGVLTALYPGAIGASVFVLSEAPFCPVMLAQLVCWVAAVRARSGRRAALLGAAAGLLAGAATLIRPSWLLFTPAALAVALVGRRGRRRQAAVGLLMLAAFAITMLPWWIRNYCVSGRFVATTLQVGASLYDGLNEQATGASDMRFVGRFYAEQKAADAASPVPPAGSFEARLDRRMRDAAVAWARAHPRRVLELMGVKLLRMWSPWPNAAEMQAWSFRLAVLLGFTPLALAAGWGAWSYVRRGGPYLLCALPAVYFTGLHMIFVSSIRYRQPPMLPLLVLAAGILSQRILARLGRAGAASAS